VLLDLTILRKVPTMPWSYSVKRQTNPGQGCHQRSKVTSPPPLSNRALSSGATSIQHRMIPGKWAVDRLGRGLARDMICFSSAGLCCRTQNDLRELCCAARCLVPCLEALKVQVRCESEVPTEGTASIQCGILVDLARHAPFTPSHLSLHCPGRVAFVH
jgi:hypothetical protein